MALIVFFDLSKLYCWVALQPHILIFDHFMCAIDVNMKIMKSNLTRKWIPETGTQVPPGWGAVPF